MPIGTWKGNSSDPVLSSSGPKFQRTARGATITFEWTGKHSALKSFGPAIGDELPVTAFDYTEISEDEMVFCNSIELAPLGAGDDGPGKLTIVYTNEPQAGVSALTNQTTVEVESTPLEKPLMSHPVFSTGGTYALNDDDRGKIKLWQDAPSATNYGNCSANAKKFVDKLKLGIESYIVGAPTARKTTRSTGVPSVGSVGTRSGSAPVTGAPSGYEWLKMADRAVRQAPASGWERVEEWHGAKTIDADLYTGVI